MEPMQTASYLFAGATGICLGLLFLLVRWKTAAQHQKERLTEKATVGLKRVKGGYFRFDRIEEYLWKKGAVQMLGPAANPVNFLFLKATILLGIILVSITTGIKTPSAFAAAVGLGVAASFVPDLLLNLSDDGDNKEMLGDIQSLYDTLKIETHAGVYLTQALSECYLVVQNRRLKAALLDLTNEILAKNNIETALAVFERQLDNQYLAMFVIILRQSLESGQSAQMLADVSGELTNVQKAIQLTVQESLDRKIQIIQLLLFVGMMAILLYAMASSIMGALSFGI